MLYLKFWMALLTTTFICSFGYSQQDSTSSEKTKDSSVIADLTTKLDKLVEYIEKSKDTEREETGIFSIDTSSQIAVYNPHGKPDKKKWGIVTRYLPGKRNGQRLTVEKVTILVQDGYIVDIQVFAGKDVFTNTKALISINGRRFSSSSRDFLYNKRNDKQLIILQEAVSYTPIKTFFPEDGIITLSKSHTSDTVFKNVGVNTVLDLRLYTDALATLGKEPNGIFQTDVRLKQFLHRRHYSNSGGRIFGYFKVNFTASKIDSKFNFVDSSDKIPRTAFYQKSNYAGEISLNLWSNWLDTKTLNTYYIDIGGSFNGVNLARSNDTIAITVPSIFFEFGINLRNSTNIGFDFHCRYSTQYSPQTDFKDQDKRNYFLRLGAEVYWNPFKEPASRVFGRINYVMGLHSSEKKNSFSQVQLGYSILLSKAIGGK